MGCTVRPKRSANPMAACRGPLSGAAGPNSATGIVGRTRSDTVSVVSPRGPRALGERKLGALSSASCSRFLFFLFFFVIVGFSLRQRKLYGSARAVSEKRDTLAPECRTQVAAHNTTLHTRPAKPFREGYLPQYPGGKKGEGCEARKRIKERKKTKKTSAIGLEGAAMDNFSGMYSRQSEWSAASHLRPSAARWPADETAQSQRLGSRTAPGSRPPRVRTLGPAAGDGPKTPRFLPALAAATKTSRVGHVFNNSATSRTTRENSLPCVTGRKRLF